MTGSAGPAILAPVAPALLPADVLGSAGPSPDALTATPEQMQALPPDILPPVTQATADSITAIFMGTVPLLATGVAITFILPELPLKDTTHIGSTPDGAEITMAEMVEEKPPSTGPPTTRPSPSTRTERPVGLLRQRRAGAGAAAARHREDDGVRSWRR